MENVIRAMPAAHPIVRTRVTTEDTRMVNASAEKASQSRLWATRIKSLPASEVQSR